MMTKITVGDYKINRQATEQLIDVQFPFLTDTERQAVINIIWPVDERDDDTSIRLSYGPKCREFERKFSKIHGCEYGILSNSGTSSLQVALQTLKELHNWKDGDEVIVPATTFVATVNVVLHNNLKPVFIDVHPKTYGLNLSHIEHSIQGNGISLDKVKCIIPVHLFGIVGAYNYLKRLLILNGHECIKVIEDACEASFGNTLTENTNEIVGSMGDIGCFSFYIAHTLTTGVGGMATTNNPEYATKIRSLCNHGWDRKERPIDVVNFDLDEIKSRYYFSSIGHSFRVTEMEAALGLAQLETWKEDLQKRYGNVQAIYELLKPLAGKGLLQLPHKATTSMMMFPIVCLQGDKWNLIRHLEKNGIETREMLPLINQPIYKNMINIDDYPISKWIIDNGFYIGCHQYLTDDDINKIGMVFNKYYNEVNKE